MTPISILILSGKNVCVHVYIQSHLSDANIWLTLPLLTEHIQQFQYSIGRHHVMSTSKYCNQIVIPSSFIILNVLSFEPVVFGRSTHNENVRHSIKGLYRTTTITCWNHLRVVIRKNWNDTEKISMVPAQG